jgi:hypothetical protein
MFTNFLSSLIEYSFTKKYFMLFSHNSKTFHERYLNILIIHGVAGEQASQLQRQCHAQT